MSVAKSYCVVLLLASAPGIHGAPWTKTPEQQQITPQTTPGYDASANAAEAEHSASDTFPLEAATNAYQKDSAADDDAFVMTDEDLRSNMQPIYSSDDESTHAIEHAPGVSPVPQAAAAAAVLAPTAAAGDKLVSINDLTLGLDSPASLQQGRDRAPNMYESDELLTGGDSSAVGKPIAEAASMAQPLLKRKTKISPSAPGGFRGGPSLAEQHAGWKLDSDEKPDRHMAAGGTFVAAASSVPTGGLDRNVLASLNDDLSFHLNKIGKERTAGGSGRRRGLLHVDSDSPESIDSADSTTHPDDDSSNTYERDSTDADKETVVELEKAEYAEAAFELPAAIVQAAQVQAEELRQLLAARSPRVQLNKEPVPDVTSLSAVAAATEFGAEAAAVPSSLPARHSHRKLFSMPDSVTQLLSTKGGRMNKPLWGITYSWRRAEDCDGERHVCRCPQFDDLEDDMDLLYKYSKRIRTYSAECPELMRMMLHHITANPDVSWLLGVWIGRDAMANQAQVDLLAKILPQFPNASLAGIVVGNEALSRLDVTQSQLIEVIGQVRGIVRAIGKQTNSQILSQVPVMTAELPGTYTTELANAVDVIGANIQPFYMGTTDAARHKKWASKAVSAALGEYSALQTKFRGKQVVITEVGWPSRSGEMDTNRASTDDAVAFARAWVQAADKQTVPYFYHELADATWKAALRKGAAVAARGGPNKGGIRQPGLLSMGILADEHFGLVTADRLRDKGLLELPAASR